MLIALKTDPFSNTTLASLARQFGDEKQCGTTCLYGPSDYTTTNSHPPVVGFSYDGHLIYGRYLDSSAPGYAAPLLDACGGHEHDTAGTDEYGISLQNYHYHTQIFDAEVESGQTAESGEAYVASQEELEDAILGLGMSIRKEEVAAVHHLVPVEELDEAGGGRVLPPHAYSICICRM